MKRQKNIMAILTLIAGILCVIYYFFAFPGSGFGGSIITVPKLLNVSAVMLMVDAVMFIIAGLFGIFTTARTSRIILYSVMLAFSVITAFITPALFYAYPLIIVALAALIIQIVDKSPETRLFVVVEKGDILMTFDNRRPTYKKVYSERHSIPYDAADDAELIERFNKAETVKPQESRRSAARTANRRTRKINKRTGYAISPKSRNYRKNLKRKNKKR